MRKRKIIKRDITKDQFLTILNRACRPANQQSDSESVETSESHHSDDYSEKHTHSDKTGDI